MKMFPPNKRNQILILLLLGLMTSGCGLIKPLKYDYSFDCINEGKETVWIDLFKLTEGETRDANAVVGILQPGGSKSTALFRERPLPKITLSWCPAGKDGAEIDSPSEKRTQMDVILNLPKEFTPKSGSEIRLYIIPEARKYRVEYEIMNPRTGDTRIVRP